MIEYKIKVIMNSGDMYMTPFYMDINELKKDVIIKLNSVMQDDDGKFTIYRKYNNDIRSATLIKRITIVDSDVSHLFKVKE